MGLLSIVATPIGNLEDITLRAIRVLKEADYILCEDTRVTGKLLKHASEQVHADILADLEAGKHIALVSDAGTPGVSDPGVLLIGRAREAGVIIEVIPGPSAVTAAFSISGLVGNQFSFLGFVPQKKGRETFFKKLSSYEHPVIFFESTHRILKTLGSLQEYYSGSHILIGRELTKHFEEVLSGTAAELLSQLQNYPEKQKGEFVVIFSK